MIILLQYTSNTTACTLHPTLAKLAENEITACTFLQTIQGNLPSFLTLLAFPLLIIIFVLLIFTLNIFSFDIHFQISSFPFKSSSDSIVNAKSSP